MIIKMVYTYIVKLNLTYYNATSWQVSFQDLEEVGISYPDILMPEDFVK